MFEDTKGVISSRISKDKQYKAKRANSDLQNITHTNKKNHNPIKNRRYIVYVTSIRLWL